MTVLLLKNENLPVDAYREALAEYDPVFVPLLTHSLEVQKMADFLKNEVHKYQILIITSQRAVECLGEAMKIAQNHTVLDLPIYTIGPLTGGYLERLGFTNIRGQNSGNGYELSKLILMEVDVHTQRMIFFTGAIRKDIIPKALSHGLFEETSVYSTQERAHDAIDLLEKFSCGGHWVVFFSSQGTRDIVEKVKQLRQNYKVAVIGPTTNEYLTENGLVVDAVCEKPTATDLLRVLQKLN